LLGGSFKEYDKCVVTYSIKNQLRYKGNLGEAALKISPSKLSTKEKYNTVNL